MTDNGGDDHGFIAVNRLAFYPAFSIVIIGIKNWRFCNDGVFKNIFNILQVIAPDILALVMVMIGRNNFP